MNKEIKSTHLILLMAMTATLAACGGSGGDGVVNNAPVATDAGISLLPGTSVTGTLAVSDADGDSLSISIVTAASNGTVSITDATTGAYSYTHDGSANGDSFTFWANDGLLDSNIATVTVSTTLPAVPASGLLATPGDQRITLNWDAVSGADSYNVYWYGITGTGTGGTAITGVTPPFYHDNLTNGTNYYYVVTAVNAVGESTSSNELAATSVDVLISSLSFTDTNLATCVADTATASTLTYVHELTLLICGSKGIVEIGGIEALTSLTDLRLYDNSISDISALSGLTGLTYLPLDDNSISDVSALSGLTGLTDLSLNGNNISDVSALSGLTGLTDLFLNNNSISDVSALSGLTSLTYLYLDNNNINDVSTLSGLTSLIDLSLNGNNISDVSALSGLSGLTDLSLYSNSISDVSNLSGLTGLTALYLHYNSISDISALSGLTSLTTLRLSNNSISNVSALSGLTGLTYLNLGNNNISDISALSSLTGLTKLYLYRNNIIDISALSGLTGLTNLYLDNNSIGGLGIGNVDDLVTLTSATYISLTSNIGMSCSELGTLITALSAVDIATATDGVNCTNDPIIP